jgi:hypothetical protein
MPKGHCFPAWTLRLSRVGSCVKTPYFGFGRNQEVALVSAGGTTLKEHRRDGGTGTAEVWVQKGDGWEFELQNWLGNLGLHFR